MLLFLETWRDGSYYVGCLKKMFISDLLVNLYMGIQILRGLVRYSRYLMVFF